MVVWEVSLVFPLELKTRWAIIIQQRIPYSPYKHVWELHIETPEDGRIWVNRGGGKGEEQRQVPWMQPGELTVGLGRGEKSGCSMHSLQPWVERQNKHSCLSGGHILWLNPVTRAEGTQRCCSCVLAATIAMQKTKPWRLAISFHPPRTCLPLLYWS